MSLNEIAKEHALPEKMQKAWFFRGKETIKTTETCPNQPLSKQSVDSLKTKAQFVALTQSTRQTFLSLPCQDREKESGWGGIKVPFAKILIIHILEKKDKKRKKKTQSLFFFLLFQ